MAEIKKFTNKVENNAHFRNFLSAHNLVAGFMIANDAKGQTFIVGADLEAKKNKFGLHNRDALWILEKAKEHILKLEDKK